MQNSKKQEKKENGNFSLRAAAAEELRRSADRLSDKQQKDSEQKLIHELQVHQIELEMQNEELRRTQTELEASRARYFDLYNMAPVGYITLSEKGLIKEANLTVATLLGVERSQLVNQPLSRFILPEDQDLYYLHQKRLLEAPSAGSGQAGVTQVWEMRLIKKDGDPFWTRVEVGAVQQVYDGPLWRVIISDITELQQVVAALLESEKGLRKLNERILNMVMILSHDVRGPLISIISILKLLLRGSFGKLDQNLANTVKDLLSRCLRLLGTTEDYIGKASIVGGSVKMEREVLDLRQDIIDIVLEEMADDIAKHEIVIDNRLGTIPAGSITISASKTWLKAVYRNLFTNAIKYGGKGCTISFGFEPRESHYRLNVYNSGNPVPEPDRGKLFSRFERIEIEGRPFREGVGLGLSLCHDIILDHGGEIWYEALPDGSNFVFTISKEEVVKR